MRTQMFGSFLLVALVGCGGGGDSKPDAKIFLDAAIDAPPMCGIPSAPLNGSVGSVATPAMGNFFQNPTSGQYMGRTIFALGILLPSGTVALADSIEVVAAKPTTGPFPKNTAIPFEINPAVMAPAGRSVGFGDEDSATMTVQNLYWPSSGSITYSAIAEATGSTITAQMAMTTYREIDENGADIVGGCTMAITLAFNLRQMPPAFQPGTNGAPSSPFATPGAAQMTATFE